MNRDWLFGVNIRDGAFDYMQEARETLLKCNIVEPLNICSEGRHRLEQLLANTSIGTSLTCEDECHSGHLGCIRDWFYI